MRGRFALLLLALAVPALAGCGGGGGSTSTGSTGSSKASGPAAGAFKPKPHHDSGGGAAQFTVKGGDNSVQEFGAEASESELQEAAAALHGFLDARTERNWAAACTYLDAAVKQSFAGLGTAPARPCATSLAALTGKTSSSTLREAAVADVGSLRAEGDRGFLIYRGAGGGVYAIPVAREHDAWKVAGLSGLPLD
jgi:hypothetical protein